MHPLPIPAPIWRGSAYIRCYFYLLIYFFCPLYPPVSGIVPRIFAVLLLYYYRTHIVGLWVVAGCFFFCSCAALHYCCTTYWCYTSVVRGGWVDRFVGVSMGSWFFFFFCTFSRRDTAPAPAYFGVPLVQRQAVNSDQV